MQTQTLTILGSTGSIGRSTLDVVARHRDRFRVFALTGHTQMAVLARQCLDYSPRYAVVSDAAHVQTLRRILADNHVATEVLFGQQALVDVACDGEVDTVMAAIVGVAGLPATLAAAQAGKTVCLANKEALVVSGSLFMQAVATAGGRVLPVDSEHNAIFQVLSEGMRDACSRGQASCLKDSGIQGIILTASGGPFWQTELADLMTVTPEQAVSHPNWSMGRKISVDSATMMNKGLELIEAHWLFGCAPEALEVVIHPQSVVHSMVRYADGSVLAQMGRTDMRIPIACCLAWPERIDSGTAPLDLTALGGLVFASVDMQRFPGVKLAYEVMRQGGVAPCVFNAANEVAVAAFLSGGIRFTDIVAVVEHCLSQSTVAQDTSIEDLLRQDAATRVHAQHWIGQR